MFLSFTITKPIMDYTIVALSKRNCPPSPWKETGTKVWSLMHWYCYMHPCIWNNHVGYIFKGTTIIHDPCRVIHNKLLCTTWYHMVKFAKPHLTLTKTFKQAFFYTCIINMWINIHLYRPCKAFWLLANVDVHSSIDSSQSMTWKLNVINLYALMSELLIS